MNTYNLFKTCREYGPKKSHALLLIFRKRKIFFRNFPPQNVQGVGNERETNNGTLSALPNHRLCSESCDRKVSLSGPPNERSALQTSRNSFGESILSVAAPFLHFLSSVYARAKQSHLQTGGQNTSARKIPRDFLDFFPDFRLNFETEHFRLDLEKLPLNAGIDVTSFHCVQE